ncbi:UNVERIFIED_ORG: hypothetical protein JN05_01253 [Zoogloea ramigera]|uniref:Uncharacterized protein n=1 Tax=Duganella zoogloeoides TaxID=75659 RepID=A0ABZ0Y5I8_9BURK|nr:hypothetical protein [Duganella zoogloeoides]WQH06859.1 hypothetical protein SR858_11175 [Duganella zoogloeoides]
MAIELKYFKTRVVKYPMLAGSLLAALILTGLRAQMSSGDWAMWVGAVGTVGALIGTVWLATAQTRRLEREALVRARIHASALTYKLQDIREVIGLAAKDLLDAIDIASGDVAIERCIHKIKSIELWEADDLIPIIPLKEKAAAGLLTTGALTLNFPAHIRLVVLKSTVPADRAIAIFDSIKMLNAIDASLHELSEICFKAGEQLLLD